MRSRVRVAPARVRDWRCVNRSGDVGAVIWGCSLGPRPQHHSVHGTPLASHSHSQAPSSMPRVRAIVTAATAFAATDPPPLAEQGDGQVIKARATTETCNHTASSQTLVNGGRKPRGFGKSKHIGHFPCPCTHVGKCVATARPWISKRGHLAVRCRSGQRSLERVRRTRIDTQAASRIEGCTHPRHLCVTPCAP